MTSADAAALLQSLGFTDYEARAYVALLGAADLNGYEVAKASGIPRANIYPILERLVERHAARRLETPDGKRYGAIAPRQLLARLEREHRQSLGAARTALAELESTPAEAPVFNVRGRDELLAHARDLLATVRGSLQVAIQPTEAAALASALAEARARGVRITTLCMEACATECGGCAGDIHRYQLAPAGGTRWLLLVADGRRVVAGEVRGGATQGVATEQPLIAELAASYIRQSLALATMAGTLGERFDGLLSEQARKVLDALHPDGGFLAWLHHAAGHEAA